MNLRTLLLMASVLVMSGCATQPLTLNYGPTSTMSVDGAMSVGDFRYIPAENGKTKPNQIPNTAMGEVIFEKNIDEYIETALFTEARFVGIDVGKGTAEVSGSINEFSIDDLGFNVDWVLDISYQVKNENGICFETRKVVEKRTEKFGNVFGALNEVIKLNIEQLFSEPEFVRCIN